MKIMMIKFMLMISSSIPLLSNPMQMGITLLMQTMISMIIMNFILTSSWITMITFMMMVGGLLILFIYMGSIASNEKMTLKLNIIIPMVFITMIMDDLIINQINETMSNEFNETDSIMKMYNKSMHISILMILYLLLTMIMVSKIIKKNKGPLRMKYE